MATKVRTIFANMSWMMVSQIITSICAFVWTIMTARYLGVSDYGLFGFAVSLTGIFGILQDLGIQTHIVRSIAADNSVAEKYLGNAVTIRFLLSFLYFAVILIALILLNASFFTIFITMLFAFEGVVKGMNSLFFGSFQAFEKLKYQAISNTILNISTLFFILLVVFLDYGLEGIAYAYILASILAIVYSIIVLRKHVVKPKLEFDYKFSKQLIIWGLPFALTSIFYIIYYQIDIVMLTKFVGNYATGMYNASYKLINVLSLFYGIYTAVIFPVMSKLFKSQKDMLRFSFEKSVKYLLLITIPISFGMSFYATDIMSFIYGQQYIHADVILQILIWTVSFMFVNGACATVLNASHKEYSVTKIYIIAAIFNVVLNLVLIPNYSYVGASIATVLSDVLILFICLYVLNKIDQLPGKHIIVDIVKIIFATAILAIALYILNLSMWVAIPVGLIIYLVVIFLLRTLDEDDKNIVRQIIGK